MVNSLSQFQPIKVVTIDVDAPIPHLSPERADNSAERYSKASVFARLHDEPLGTLFIDLPEEGVAPDELAKTLWTEFAEEIKSHLRRDELPSAEVLAAEGLGRPKSLPCWSIVDDVDDLPMVSVVIPTRDRADELERVLHTILELDGPPFEVIIIDNAAKTDATERMVADKFAGDDRVRYFSQRIPGISPARNRGIAEARGEIVAFTDDDVVVDRHWLRAIVRALRQNPQADAITGLVLPAAFETQSQLWFEEFGGFNKGFSARLFTAHPEPGDPLLYPYTAGSYGSGNNIAFWTKTLRVADGFDERLGVGSPTRAGEDLDVFLHIILGGGAIVYEPAAIISHFHREDYEGLRGQLYNYGVGLAAVYVKWTFKRPVGILRRLPRGLWYLLSPKSGKNEQRSATFPRDLVTAELRGMLRGPLAYARAVFSSRQQRG